LDSKAPDAFRTISEVAEELDLPQHVLRFWETRFREIKPMKRGGGRRYYRPDDIGLLRGIRHLLYSEGYTIRGVQRILREQGIRFVQEVWQEGAIQPPDGAGDEDDIAEDTASTAGMADEGNGLRGRLTSLIGRDLDDRRDDVTERREPPLESAPEPRIDPQDRDAHGPASPEPVPAASPTVRALEADDRAKLEAALSELAVCRKLIEAAVARPE
jgi:DNA-binding transcriptional MerR regulator